MKAILTFKQADPWSGFTVYKDCKHAIGTYLKRSGVNYTGLEGDELLRERLEKAMGLDLRPNSEFWKTFRIFLGENDVHLDTEKSAEDELKYYFLKGHKRVAFGLNDRKPSTDYVLLQEEEEAKETNVKARAKRKAITEFDKLTPNEMRKALRLYGYNSTNTSIEVVESSLFKLVEENPNRFLQIWVNNKAKETQFLIEEAVSKEVLRKNKTTYYYGTDTIGHTLDAVVEYLDNPANADLKLSIKAQLEGKSYSFGSSKPERPEKESQFSRIMSEMKDEAKEEVLKKSDKKSKKSDD